ncbi:MAG: transketolase [Deltaproteobacteria bacterium]
MSNKEIQDICARMRGDILRMIAAANSGHPGGSLSSVEVIATLYFDVLNYRVGEPDWSGRDRFVISKGHGVPTVYAALAEAGCIERTELEGLRRLGSRLQGHPDHVRLPYLEAATGSLGQGLSVAAGMALGESLDTANDYRVYCLIGDGETQAGQIWEAAMAAGNYGLGKLTTVLDYNKVQLDGRVESIMDLEPLAEKWQAFGWHTIEIDGHDLDAVSGAFAAAAAVEDRPSIIIAHTVKGKGVSFMEDTYAWHGKAPNAEELERALGELGAGGGAR